MILSRHPAILINPPEGDFPRAVRISSPNESSFIIEYCDVIEHPEVSYQGILEHNPQTGHFEGHALDGTIFNFDISGNGGLVMAYQPLSPSETFIEVPGLGVNSYSNASLAIEENMMTLSGYGVELIRFYQPAVLFFDEIKYDGPTENKVYGERKIEIINPMNGQRIVATLYDKGCGCSVERIEQKLGDIKIYPIGE